MLLLASLSYGQGAAPPQPGAFASQVRSIDLVTGSVREADRPSASR
jgi:hypothetical protein